MTLVGAIEAGGTKFRAGVLNESLDIVHEVRVETTQPEPTLDAVLGFFEGHDIATVGIASFGPLVVDSFSPDYGAIASTPKPGWTGTPLLHTVRERLGVPADIQTDVEAAAIAEHRRGAGRGHRSVAYVTVGTGIGIGVAIDGTIFRGRDHLELGHIPVKRHPDDTYAGHCPFHGDCLEGLACGPALIDRWGMRPSEMEDRDEVWEMEAFYLAQLVRVLAYSFAPDRILFSGGVAVRSQLRESIADQVVQDLAGYSVSHATNADLVGTAALGNDAGLIGAGLLAQELLS